MTAFSDRLADAVSRKGPLCVGIDPRWESLPKAIRRQVVPAADWAQRLLGELSGTAGMRAHEGERPAGTLADTLAATISRLTGSRRSEEHTSELQSH